MTGPTGGRRPLLLVAILLVAANLRPTVSSVGPLLAEIRADLHLSSAGASLLTTLPVLCFGLIAPFGPRVARRLGLEPAVALVALGIVVGLLVRMGPSGSTLLGGTVIAGASIAIGNVLVPPLIRRDFPERIGLLMGTYTASLTIASTLAAAVSVPLALASGLGWRGGLGFWALPAAIGLVVWLPHVRAAVRRDAVARPTVAAGSARPMHLGALLRSPIAWAVTLFMGLQSFVFYATLAWLPSVYRSLGMSPTDAGLLLSLTTFVAIPSGLLATLIADRSHHQSAVAAGATAIALVGLAGLALAPAASPLLWATILGLGQGATFPLALTLIVLRSGSVETTARLSAMTQSIGYGIAALGPLTVGFVHDATGAWGAPMALLVALSLLQLGAAFAAGRHGTVEGRAT